MNKLVCSNRCAALLKLQKAGKALSDAETCIHIRPDWEKGHYRKAMVLEAMGELSQVCNASNMHPDLDRCSACTYFPH